MKYQLFSYAYNLHFSKFFIYFFTHVVVLDWANGVIISQPN